VIPHYVVLAFLWLAFAVLSVVARRRALVAYMAPVRGVSAGGRPGEPSHPHAPARGGGSLDGCELAVPRRAGRPGLLPGHQPLPVRHFR
jgi:hypothetical protein